MGTSGRLGDPLPLLLGCEGGGVSKVPHRRGVVSGVTGGRVSWQSFCDLSWVSIFYIRKNEIRYPEATDAVSEKGRRPRVTLCSEPPLRFLSIPERQIPSARLRSG